MRDDKQDEPIAESVFAGSLLEPEPLPLGAELTLAQHILRQELKKGAGDGE